MKYDYDCIILGGGPAGLVAAKVARGFGKRVAIIENNQLGGTCTITGCVPSKTLIHIAKLVHESKKAAVYGNCTPMQLDTEKIMARVHATIAEIAVGHSPDALHTLGIDVLFGNAHFLDKYRMALTKNSGGSGMLSAKKFIIATGSRPFVPDLPGLSSVSYLTNESLFTLEKLPESLLILGGGPVGVELAQALQRLGTTCTIIERNPTILAREDHELIPLVTATLTKEGVSIQTETTAVSVAPGTEKSGITLTCKDRSGNEILFTAKQLLIAVGRKPNIEDLGLEKAGVRLLYNPASHASLVPRYNPFGMKASSRRPEAMADRSGSLQPSPKGYGGQVGMNGERSEPEPLHPKGIQVNSYLQTTASHIYACGDVVGPYQFSHMAEYQAAIATRNAFIPIFKKKVDNNQRTWVTFTDPECAVMGLTEKEAAARYPDNIVIHRSFYNTYDRPRIDNETTGMAKIICKKNGAIIGAHIFGARAGELIAQLNLGAYYKLKLQDLYNPIQPYPTYTDVIWQVAKKAYVASLMNNPFLSLIQKLASLLAGTKK